MKNYIFLQFCFNQAIFFVLLNISIFIVANTPKLKCGLTWTPYSQGNQIPFSAVPCYEKSDSDKRNYVARATINGQFYVGNLVMMDRKGYFAYPSKNGTATISEEFEILSNPSKCSLTWSNSNPNFRVTISIESSAFKIGRAEYDGKYYGGYVKSSSELVLGIDEYTDIYTANSFLYLLSYSGGFALEIRDFVFDSDIFGGAADFMGIDEIHNYADTIVTQELVHKTSIKEVMSVTVSKTTTHTQTETVGLNLAIYSSTKTTSNTYSHTNTTEITTETETDVIVSRSIIVPPNTAIIACTVIFVKEGFEATYYAKGKYTAKGLTPQEVLQEVKGEVPGAYIKDNQVFVDTTGVFKGSIALSTKFIVAPIEAMSGCKSILAENRTKEKLKFRTFNKTGGK